jgi:hypothetical protein
MHSSCDASQWAGQHRTTLQKRQRGLVVAQGTVDHRCASAVSREQKRSRQLQRASVVAELIRALNKHELSRGPAVTV